MGNAWVYRDTRMQGSKDGSKHRRNKEHGFGRLGLKGARKRSKEVRRGIWTKPSKIASLMGVFSATLSMWIAGTAKPSGANLLLIKRFLERRDFSQTGLSSDLT